MRDATIIRGSERSITIQAYTEMSMPACDSVTEKLEAISVKSATGINSEVQKINVEIVIPAKGNASRAFMCCFFRWVFNATNTAFLY